MHGVNDRVPVHHFLAVEEMTVEDKAKGCVFLVLRIHGLDRECCGERLEPVE
jgi:hypothetical protein